MSKKPETTALVKRESFAVIKAVDTVLSLVDEATGGRPLQIADLDRVRMPAGGAQYWEVPAISGAPEAQKELVGVVVYHTARRAYWKDKFEGASNPPDCHSNDGINGGFGPCRDCAFSKWGSAIGPDGKPGRGQACKQMKFVFFHRATDVLPIIIVLPPTSIRTMEKYVLRLASKLIPYYSVVTRLSLAVAENKDHMKYSVVAPMMVDQLTPEETAQLKKIAVLWRDMFESVTVEGKDYTETPGTEGEQQ